MQILGCAVILVSLWAAALSAADLRSRRLPNALTVPGAVVMLTAAAVVGRLPSALLGATALSAVYLAVHLAAPAAMGAGDVKLAVGLGALTGALGAEVWALGALGAPLLTAAAGLLSVARGRGGAVPHGPSMCAASLAAAALAVF